MKIGIRFSDSWLKWKIFFIVSFLSKTQSSYFSIEMLWHDSYEVDDLLSETYLINFLSIVLGIWSLRNRWLNIICWKMNLFQASIWRTSVIAAVLCLALTLLYRCAVYVELRDWSFCTQFVSIWLLGNFNNHA